MWKTSASLSSASPVAFRFSEHCALAFAFLVPSFTAYNTAGLTVGDRSRELADDL
jgi:hypothetical protein